MAILICLFGLPFYFGYGNPLPFINPDYTLWDNIWLTIFPLMFAGLISGLKFPMIGGFLVTIPLLIGFISGFIVEKELVLFMLIPFTVGIFYIIIGVMKKTAVQS